MLHGLVDACFLIDTQGKVLFQNFAAEDAFGYDSSIIGTNIKEITPPETRAKHDMYLRYVEKKMLCFFRSTCLCFSSRYLETGNARVIGAGS